MSSDSHTAEGVAIIGMAGRFPGAPNVNEFWENLTGGCETVSTFTDDECRSSGVPDMLLKNKTFVKRGGVLEGIDLFDASFFGYSPREASYIDPQQRIFLECAYEALENAGYWSEAYDGSIGIYAGCGMNNYLLKNLMATSPQMESVVTPMTYFGNDKDFLTTRVSYQFNLTGPSIGIQTACSTSLTAIQLACQGLLTYQCDMALSGGVSLQSPRMKGYLYLEGQILSSDGYCRAFDKDATGTVFGEGLGIVVLKRIEDAIADRDTIYAVIRGIAANNDGNSKAGFAAPSVDGQAAVIALAHGIADVEAEDISYIEAHGTGTSLGDPIEIEALTQAFSISTQQKGFCAIGSVKPNIGHLDVAAGVASIIKTALALKNRTIPASINFSEPNPELNLESSPFFINDKLKEWETDGKPRIAGVSSFGIGGTNAHAVLEQAPLMDSTISLHPHKILLLSAKTGSALDKMTANLKVHIAGNHNINLSDAAFTLMVGRKHYDYRRFVICNETETAVENLNALDAQTSGTGMCSPQDRKIVFMFSGQGAQYPQMARALYKHLPVFREEFDKCSEILLPIMGLDIRNVIYPDKSDIDSSDSRLRETWITQPALFVVEYAYAKFLMHCGIIPEAMIGHSIGEYVAACIAGVFSLNEALALVAARGRLIQEQERGAMLAIQLPEEDVTPLINEYISIATVNSATQCVVSGPIAEIEKFQKMLVKRSNGGKKKTHCVNLKTSHAFHSRMMDPAAEALEQIINKYDLKSPLIPFVSNVTGRYITADQATDAGYWASHLTQTVRFSDGIKTILRESSPLMIEVGPGMTLASLARQHLRKDDEAVALSTIRHRDQKTSDFAFMLNTLGSIWTQGIEIDWRAFYKDEMRMRIPLPSYPFERKRLWIDQGKKKFVKGNASAENDAIDHKSSNYKNKAAEYVQDDMLDDVESRLLLIWNRVLGAETVSRDDDFFELGGHSLLAAQLFAEIESAFGKNIPLSSLYHSSTIAKLSKLIRDEDNVQWLNIVPIRSTGTRPPIFLVHGAEGNVLLYRDLAKHLGEDQPIYGLQADGLDGRSEINADFQNVAQKYLKQIREVQPSGPYRLCGYCLGGTISLEIAQQLHSMGEKVNFLGMIEIYNIQSLKWPLPIHIRIYNKYLNVWYHFLNTIFASNENKWRFLKDKAGVQWGRLKVSAKVGCQKLMKKIGIQNKKGFHHIKVDEAFDHALTKYFPQKYPGRITLFVPNRLPVGFKDPQTYGFGEVAEEGINRIEIPVYPRGTLIEPYVKDLAERLRDCLDHTGESNPNGQTNA